MIKESYPTTTNTTSLKNIHAYMKKTAQENSLQSAIIIEVLLKIWQTVLVTYLPIFNGKPEFEINANKA